MKTPREILLERHRAAEPKLDAVRRAAIEAVCDSNQGIERRSQTAATGQGFAALCLRCLSTPWQELILPSRRIWTGLAMVWMVLFFINISQRDNVSSVTGQPVHSPPVMLSWQAQQRLMNEVLADRMTPPDVDRPRNVAPRPQTENGAITIG